MTLVLASKSAVRAQVLRGAGVDFDVVGSGVDETKIKRRMSAEQATPRAVAERLAQAKALAVSKARPADVVLGADQTLELDGALIDKAQDLAEARDRLLALRGRTHFLHAATAAAVGDTVVWRLTESPRMTMRDFSDAFLDGYLKRNGEALLASVGCYQLEGEGAQLFETIEGDYFAVLGLPLLPLLAFLRRQGVLPS
jgi:nucleoside triphosphate pyrophosphatase